MKNYDGLSSRLVSNLPLVKVMAMVAFVFRRSTHAGLSSSHLETSTRLKLPIVFSSPQFSNSTACRPVKATNSNKATPSRPTDELDSVLLIFATGFFMTYTLVN
uniref:(northern house mosquito) hypothetical protein n=1 Tax=Culex pipiens TaxID=7175 RepID=A0A8D8D517_CULPI